jgi:hypothetical protein
MVKKFALILAILAVMAMFAAVCSAYTVSMWPDPNKWKVAPNGPIYNVSNPCLPGFLYLRGPVAPSCTPPLIPGAIHAGLSVPFRAMGLIASPIFWGGTAPNELCCEVKLGRPAYVTAAVPCTPVRQLVAPNDW